MLSYIMQSKILMIEGSKIVSIFKLKIYSGFIELKMITEEKDDRRKSKWPLIVIKVAREH